MADLPLKEQIIQQLDRLDDEQLQALLNYSHTLSRPVGEPGINLIRDARKLTFTAQDLEEMERAIEEDCQVASCGTPTSW